MKKQPTSKDKVWKTLRNPGELLLETTLKIPRTSGCLEARIKDMRCGSSTVCCQKSDTVPFTSFLFSSWPLKLYSALITCAPFLHCTLLLFLSSPLSLSLLLKHYSGLNLGPVWSNIPHYTSHTSLLPSYISMLHRIPRFFLCLTFIYSVFF